MAVAMGLHIYFNVHYNVYWDESSSGTKLLFLYAFEAYSHDYVSKTELSM